MVFVLPQRWLRVLLGIQCGFLKRKSVPGPRACLPPWNSPGWMRDSAGPCLSWLQQGSDTDGILRDRAGRCELDEATVGRLGGLSRAVSPRVSTGR